ncbi:mitochondrial peptide methionine sulfoxide reductase isoform X1 [Protopterus annectens]|uniref:mitochondrial peptide methionine sulfoxide reductase isoform X1 n=1 Tax=Protopterus annectens TaxID=7888 RepID=UPI001CF982B4|nr:mitochondrial peptide methionine sulfoxide reductase isoform X1 [Protopterus annectens]
MISSIHTRLFFPVSLYLRVIFSTMPGRTVLPSKEQALPGRAEKLSVPERHKEIPMMRGSFTVDVLTVTAAVLLTYGIPCCGSPTSGQSTKESYCFKGNLLQLNTLTSPLVHLSDYICLFVDFFAIAARHAVSGNPTCEPFPPEMQMATFAMGCFWGAERKFWQQPGVFSTQVGYTGGFTPNPTYKEICSGLTGHAEVVRVIYDPEKISYQQLLKVFWESHNPAQGMRQGNDVGTQYRSGIYTYIPQQMDAAVKSRDAYQEELTKRKLGNITTEIREATEFYYAEDYHQQYLHKNPYGYCGLSGTGVACPIGLKISGEL